MMVSFDLDPGSVIAGKYQVIEKLGSGWEGEVYRIVEGATGVECAAKLFFPERNINNRAARTYAKKLHELRDCQCIVKYHTQEWVTWHGTPIAVLISEFVEGRILSDYLSRLPGKRLTAFQGTHLLHTLASGLESIHYYGFYHGDLHPENIIVRRIGLSYDVKFLDLYQPSGSRRENVSDDICSAIRIFYDSVGGRKYYSRQPVQVKEICCGLKRSLILSKFRNASALRLYLENQEWD
ncbi:MAG: protein kinase [Betaproteobacteria bacterium]|nr:MAG: protein kinase [Betaproteobacteria bacterium]